MKDIKNKKPGMEYRRFGKTGIYLSTITLGGMRFKHGWDEPRHQIPKDTFEQALNTVKLAFASGINQIETAWGYKKSETVFGKVLNEELFVPRTTYHLMTKGNPMTADETYETVENQLRHLQTDYLDFYGWHGINTPELFKQATRRKGPIEALLKLKEEGIIKHIGFSTHGPTDVILKSIESGLFEFVNLHYYYFNQVNRAAVDKAKELDLGVFIISPNDKGGQLFKAPDKVRKATAPLTPIQWNARFCLSHPNIHTLSFGITEPEHFEEMKGIFPITEWTQTDENIKQKLDGFINDDPFAWYDGRELPKNASEINIPEILRLRKLWKCYDMEDFCKYRYKVFEEKSHWFPGLNASEQNLSKADFSAVPKNIPLKEMLAEAHKTFYAPPKYKLAKN